MKREKNRFVKAIQWITLVFLLILLPSVGPSSLEGDFRGHRGSPARDVLRVSQWLEVRAQHLSPDLQWSLALAIEKNARRFRLDPAMILSIIEVESAFKPKAISSVEALGLMQVRPFVAQDMALRHQSHWTDGKDLYAMEKNVFYGSLYLREMLDRFDNNLEFALSAYNHGPTKIQKLLDQENPLPLEYAHKVWNAYQSIDL